MTDRTLKTMIAPNLYFVRSEEGDFYYYEEKSGRSLLRHVFRTDGFVPSKIHKIIRSYARRNKKRKSKSAA